MRLKDRWYLEICAAFSKNDERPAKAAGKRTVLVTITSKRPRDHANNWLAADKLIFDNLVKLGWLTDDDEAGLSPSVVGKVGDPATLIEIYETAVVSDPKEGGTV